MSIEKRKQILIKIIINYMIYIIKKKDWNIFIIKSTVLQYSVLIYKFKK